MNKFSLSALGHPARLFTDTELANTFSDTEDSRYSKLKRWVNKGKIIRLRRGLYYKPNDSSYLNSPHPFDIAQYIYGPSYISFESALSYHNLIPEAVYTVTSACVKRTKEFHTPLGEFSYLHLPVENFYTEVELVKQKDSHFFLATPWKAICDYVYFYKKEWKNVVSLYENLRIHPDDLPLLTDEIVEALNDYYRQKRVQRFLKGIKE